MLARDEACEEAITGYKPPYWIPVMVKPGQHRRVQDAFRDEGIDVKVFWYSRFTVYRGRLHKRVFPLLGSYVLVALPDELLNAWSHLNAVDGVARIVTIGGRLIRVPCREVDAITLDCALGLHDRTIMARKEKTPRRRRRPKSVLSAKARKRLARMRTALRRAAAASRQTPGELAA